MRHKKLSKRIERAKQTNEVVRDQDVQVYNILIPENSDGDYPVLVARIAGTDRLNAYANPKDFIEDATASLLGILEAALGVTENGDETTGTYQRIAVEIKFSYDYHPKDKHDEVG